MASEEARKAAADLADALGCEVIARIIRNVRSDVSHSTVAPFLHAFEAFRAETVERERERCLGVLRDYIRDISDTDAPDTSVGVEYCQVMYERIAAIRSADHG